MSLPSPLRPKQVATKLPECLQILHRAANKKTHPDPVMGRGYINVRATGGAVKSLPTIGEDLGVVRGPP